MACSPLRFLLPLLLSLPGAGCGSDDLVTADGGASDAAQPDPKVYVLVSTAYVPGGDFDRLLVEMGEIGSLATMTDDGSCESAVDPDSVAIRLKVSPDGEVPRLPLFAPDIGEGGVRRMAPDFSAGVRLLELDPRQAPLELRVRLCLGDQRVQMGYSRVEESPSDLSALAADNGGEYNVNVTVFTVP